MTTYTVPVNEAETQLRQLIKQAQMTHGAVILTDEGTYKPVAVLLESKAFDIVQRHRERLFHLQHSELMQWLDRVEMQWDDDDLRQECVAVWQNNIKMLWDVSPVGVRRFGTSLCLSVQKLTADNLSLAQIDALRYALDLLSKAEIDKAFADIAYKKLHDSHLYPYLVFDAELAQLYMDDLRR